MIQKKLKKIPWDILIFSLALVSAGVRTLGTSQSSSRTLASTPLASAYLSGSQSKADQSTAYPHFMALGCLEEISDSIRIQVKEPLIRIEGEICQSPSMPQEMRIINLSNGYDASVSFQTSTQHFLTDYVPLMEGTNNLRLSWQKAGQNFQSHAQVVYLKTR